MKTARLAASLCIASFGIAAGYGSPSPPAAVDSSSTSPAVWSQAAAAKVS